MSVQQEPKRQTWWSRNWMWCVPCGIFAISVLSAALVGLAVWGAFYALRSCPVYQQALQTARQAPEVTAALGEPIEPGWYLMGNINSNNGIGNANLLIPVSGPKGFGKISFRATKTACKAPWTFHYFELHVDGQPKPIVVIDTSQQTP